MRRVRASRIILPLVLIVVLLGGADLAIRHVATTQVAQRARQATGAASASASISGFPFLYETLVQGQVHGITVHLTDVPAGPLVLQKVDVAMVGIHFDKSRIYHQRKLRLTEMDRATATVLVSAVELSTVSGHQITVSGGSLVLNLAGRTVPATATINGGHTLVVSAGGVTVFSDDLSRSPLVPPCSMTLQIVAAGVQATCTMAPVPPSVLAAVSS